MKQKNNFNEKPYNRCLVCQHRQLRCDGPRTSGMSLLRWCEFMRDMKEVNELTNSDIAERSGVSIKTIERLMAMKADQDIMRETARLIEDAIIGSSNQYPCYLAFEEAIPTEQERLNEAMRELERVLDDNKDYRQALDNIHTSYNAEMQMIRDEARKKIDHLLAENDRLKEECNAWKAESERKNRIIDTLLSK